MNFPRLFDREYPRNRKDIVEKKSCIWAHDDLLVIITELLSKNSAELPVHEWIYQPVFLCVYQQTVGYLSPKLIYW